MLELTLELSCMVLMVISPRGVGYGKADCVSVSVCLCVCVSVPDEN